MYTTSLTRSVICSPWEPSIGVSSVSITFSTSQLALIVGATVGIDSGIWIRTSVVGEPSQPWEKANVTIAELPATTASSTIETCAAADAADGEGNNDSDAAGGDESSGTRQLHGRSL